MPLTPPSDADLDTMIRARLAILGIDLNQLPTGTTSDPETGSPGQASVLASLRSFMRTTAAELSGYQVPFAGPTGNADPALLSQQAAPPALYPSIDTARRTA
ncbi:hypothetical protein [Pseudarthrobacter oxydans]|uniref:hypothetical protein n=1 Tax=Pseudarthrobacter oxydans TaxID=1671 RepID=UPI00344E620A